MVEVSAVSAKPNGDPTPSLSSRRPARAVLALVLATLAGCERSAEEPALSATPPSAPPATSDTGPASPSPQPVAVPSRCVVPLVEPPPPAAPAAAVCPPAPGGAPILPKGLLTFNEAPSSPSVTVEIATSVPDRARGLMFRTEMPQDSGMLFSWSDEQRRSFWMRNTCLPLDMLFIASDGLIVSILEQVPTLNQLPRASYCPAAHVLEVNAGWTRRHGVEPGQRVQLPSTL